LLSAPDEHKFSNGVNGTSSKYTYTTAYTSLVKVAKCKAVLLYDLAVGEGKDGQKFVGYSMQIDLHIDAGGETGVHC
jgi:hypothetical protein